MDDLYNLLPGFASHKPDVLKAISEMAELGIVEKVGEGYRLTAAGKAVFEQMLAAGMFPPGDDDEDPILQPAQTG